MNEFYLIAKILSAGKDGFVKIQFVSGFSLDPDSIKFLYLDFWDQKKRIELEDTLNIKDSFFLKFKNFDDERDVSVLVGRNIFVGRTDFEKITSNVIISQKLIGCKVYKGQNFIGIITEYFETPANPVIEISSEKRNNFLIPYVHSIFEKIDTENNILILNSDFGIDDDEN